jgi:hypothetical protein
VSIEAPDSSGNTPLHYACKYGNIDICRYLIEKGASACRKNSSNETPYDVAGDHHVVRQYLLPLQFQAERSAGDGGYSQPPQLGISSNASYGAGYGQQFPPGPAPAGQPSAAYQPPAAQHAPSIYQPAAAAPPSIYNAPSPGYYGAPSASSVPPSGEASPAGPLNPVSPPAVGTANTAAASSHASSQRSTPTPRIIQPGTDQCSYSHQV